MITPKREDWQGAGGNAQRHAYEQCVLHLKIAPGIRTKQAGAATSDGFSVPMEDQQLFGSHWDHGVGLPFLIGEFHWQECQRGTQGCLRHGRAT
jgi:hypothetical protein